MQKCVLRVGLITNDQAPELVDTAFLLQRTVHVAEVNGSCFCCSLMIAVKQMRDEVQADIIIAEPLGSWTDLYATLIRLLKKIIDNQLLIPPLTVLAAAANMNGKMWRKAKIHIQVILIKVMIREVEEREIGYRGCRRRFGRIEPIPVSRFRQPHFQKR